jgi:hypothetical protein
VFWPALVNAILNHSAQAMTGNFGITLESGIMRRSYICLFALIPTSKMLDVSLNRPLPPQYKTVLSFRLLSKNVKIKINKTMVLPVVLWGYETWFLTLREEFLAEMGKNLSYSDHTGSNL